MKPSTYQRLRVVHRYLGLSVGLLFVMQGLTGAFMAFLPEFDRMMNPELAASYDPRTALPLQDIAEQAWQQRHQRYQGVGVVLASGLPSIVMGYWPRPDPIIKGELEFRLARINPATGAVVAEDRYGAWPDDWLMVPIYIHALHTALTIGAVGRFTLIGAGIFLLLSTIIGLRLWWPGRRRLLQQLAPSSVRRTHWAQTVHRFVGPYAAVLIGLLVITGIVLQFIVSLDPIFRATSAPSSGQQQISPLRAWQAAEGLFPGATPQDLGAPFSPDGVFRVKLIAASGELQGEAVELFIDNYSARVLRVRSSANASMFEKSLALLVPLHGGAILGTAGHVLAFIVGFLPLLLLITGLRRSIEIRRRTRPSGAASRVASHE